MLYTLKNPLIFDENILDKIHGKYPNDKKQQFVSKEVADILIIYAKTFESYLARINNPIDEGFLKQLSKSIDDIENK